VRVHKGKAALICATAAAIVVSGCSSSGGGGKGGNGGNGGKLIYGESTDFPENLMPLIAAGNSTATANLEVRLLNGPFRITPQIAYEADPDQVTGQPTSELKDGQQVVTYEINPKAVWDDGQKITADDYIYTWEAQKSSDPKNGGCAALLSTTGYDQIESVKAGKDDHEVVVTYQKGKPFPDWQALFSPLLSKHVFDQGDPVKNCKYITDGWPIANGIPAGATNGPWILDKSNINVSGKSFTLTHNPKYWGAAPHLDQLVDAYVGSDADTNVKALQNQEVNMIYPQPQLDLVANLQKLSGVTTEINFGVAFEHLDFNVKDPLLAHKEVRQAIAYGIDRKALVNATVGKFSDKATILDNRLIMGNQKGYEAHGTEYDSQNVAKAQQLLESIGAKKGGDGYYTLDGKPLAFKVMTTQNNPLRDQTIQTIASQLKPVGIKITEFANPDIFAGTDKPTSLVSEGFQIALFAWVGGPAITSNRSIYLSPAGGGVGQNYTQGGTPQIDDALNKMNSATDTTEEIKWANEADKLLWDQMYTLPLYQKPTLLAFDSNFTGIGDNATQAGPLWNSETFKKKSS
jgi:peptide/nickel transport system substrate-binding protein